MDHASDDQNDSVDFPIDGTLDLHSFRPAEIGELMQHYLAECSLFAEHASS